MRCVFIRSAIHIVARDGLERTTTKAIAADAGLNEAYIYKCFSGKEELLGEALHMEDANLAVLLHEALPIMHDTRLKWKERAFLLWKRCWDFILEDEEDCVFYIRFYFSALGLNTVYQKHLGSYSPLVEQIRPTFRPETNMDMLVHQIFCTMLFFASRVMSGELEACDHTTSWAFEQVYSFIAPNVRPEILEYVE